MGRYLYRQTGILADTSNKEADQYADWPNDTHTNEERAKKETRE